MVMPRSRSKSILSKSCSDISRVETVSVSSSSRSASVDLPWSIWAMIEKLRILLMSVIQNTPTFKKGLNKQPFPFVSADYSADERRLPAFLPSLSFFLPKAPSSSTHSGPDRHTDENRPATMPIISGSAKLRIDSTPKI